MARYRSVSPLSLLAAALLLAASPAAAATLTFDGVPEGGGANCFGGGPESVAEGGFTISNCPGYWIAPGNIHLNDGGSAFSGSVEFSAPVPFRAESVTILGFGSAFTDQETWEPVAYENVLFEGFRDGALVMTYTDDAPLTGRYFGFNDWASEAYFDDLAVYRLPGG
ncbi:MAG: hypothetical protein CVT83_09075 [Alphaproteobacteria bacterium HGW-Alphaproteobacteria-5]|nr:MAG: hypothetical protein CVT83_09075 [Alphaproteobacteria bacterium HGW-Alphaproteobacteria-5]